MPAPYSTWTVREDSTEPIEFQLTADGVAVNLAGITSVEIRLRRADTGAVVSYLNTVNPSSLAITDAANGKVTFYPVDADLEDVAGHYYAFFWVIDGAGKKIPYPTDRNFIIRMIATH